MNCKFCSGQMHEYHEYHPDYCNWWVYLQCYDCGATAQVRWVPSEQEEPDVVLPQYEGERCPKCGHELTFAQGDSNGTVWASCNSCTYLELRKDRQEEY